MPAGRLSCGSLAIFASIAALTIRPMTAKAQRFYEVGAGWNAVAQAPGSSAPRFRSGPFLRGSVGGVLAPRVRARFDANAMFFRYQVEDSRPCPFPACPHPFYIDYTRGVGALAVTGLVDVDPRGILYVLGGLGAYDANGAGNSVHVGASAGAGISIPVRPRYRAFVEATWHGLAPDPTINGPRWLTPFAVGLRF